LAKPYRLWGLSCQVSLLQTIHQSLIFCDQLWASLSSATLDFKQPLHQLGEVLHDFIQWLAKLVRLAKIIGDSQGQHWSKVLTFAESLEAMPAFNRAPGAASTAEHPRRAALSAR
jgi:hypothetical protein